MNPKYSIYLDVCCLNRPLDDSCQDRIRLETEAVLLIYRKYRLGEWDLISSEAIELEIRRTPDAQRLEQVMLALSVAKSTIPINETLRQRAVRLTKLGFKAFDSAHIASAEASSADVMLTTDDRLLRNAARHQNQLCIAIDNPVSWLLKVNQMEETTTHDDAS
jgi:predicted nucleic acid-binding protein